MPDIKYTHENKEIILARIKELIERNNFIDAHNMIEALNVDNILLQRLPGVSLPNRAISLSCEIAWLLPLAPSITPLSNNEKMTSLISNVRSKIIS
jgi:hypothetical protein